MSWSSDDDDGGDGQRADRRPAVPLLHRRGDQRRRSSRGLALDAQRGERQRLEAGHGDLLAAPLADAVGADVHAAQGPVDLLHRLGRRGRQRQVALPLDVEGVALARLLVELGVARLPLGGQRLGLGGQVVGLADVGLPLLLEEAAQLVERLGREACRVSAFAGGGRGRLAGAFVAVAARLPLGSATCRTSVPRGLGGVPRVDCLAG